MWNNFSFSTSGVSSSGLTRDVQEGEWSQVPAASVVGPFQTSPELSAADNVGKGHREEQKWCESDSASGVPLCIAWAEISAMSTNFWNKYYIVSKTHYEFKTTGKLKPTATFVSSILEQYSGTMLIESAEELQFIHMYK